MSYERALKVVLGFEGGYVDDASDRGGATNYGITQPTYDGWRRTQKLPVRPVRQIERAEVDAIYRDRYWLEAGCDRMPWPLSLAHFDAAVNHGPGNAWRIMQRALGVTPDARPGPVTWGAIARADIDALMWTWLSTRTAFYVDIVRRDQSQIRFLRGWIDHRVLGLCREMQRAA